MAQPLFLMGPDSLWDHYLDTDALGRRATAVCVRVEGHAEIIDRLR